VHIRAASRGGALLSRGLSLTSGTPAVPSSSTSGWTRVPSCYTRAAAFYTLMPSRVPV